MIEIGLSKHTGDVVNGTHIPCTQILMEVRRVLKHFIGTGYPTHIPQPTLPIPRAGEKHLVHCHSTGCIPAIQVVRRSGIAFKDTTEVLNG